MAHDLYVSVDGINKVVTKPKSRRLCTAVIGILLVLFAALLVSCQKADVKGAWHNETYAQVFAFDGSGTVTLKTAAGSFKGIYVFDADKSQGTLAVLGESLSFGLKGDSIFVGNEGGTSTEFKRGDMAIAIVTPAVTIAQTPAPTTAATATPAPPMQTAVTLVTLKPGMVITPGDVIGKLIITEITGDWFCVQFANTKLTFKADGRFEFVSKSAPYGGTYTYNPDTNSGVMTEDGSGPASFAYNETKQSVSAYYKGQQCTFIKQAP